METATFDYSAAIAELDADYEKEQEILKAARWSAEQQAQITREDLSGADAVRAAELRFASLPLSSLSEALRRHRRRLSRVFGTDNLVELQVMFPRCADVRRAVRAVHTAYQVPSDAIAAKARYDAAMALPGRDRKGPLQGHAERLRRAFGTVNISRAAWNSYHRYWKRRAGIEDRRGPA